jgi:heme exporter protein D
MIQFSSFQEFIEMGGYAFNVWSVYALFTVFLVANLLLPMRRRKQLLRELKRRRIAAEQMQKNTEESARLEQAASSLGEST